MKSPVSPKALSHLFLHAVLPAFSELVCIDPEARALMAPWAITLSMGVIGETPVALEIKRGDILFHPRAIPTPHVSFLFLTHRHLNAFFNGHQWALPIITRGLWRIRFLRDFSSLADRFNLLVHDNTSRCPLYTQLTFLIGGLGLAPLATFDTFSQSLLKKIPQGLAQFSIAHPATPSLWFEHNDKGVQAGRGSPPRKPDVHVHFTDLDIANAALRNDLDTMAAIGARRIQITGLSPLAEGLGLMMERLQIYLERPV